MLQLSERLQQDIAFVLRLSRELEEQAGSALLSQPERLTALCYAASELALCALIDSDALEAMTLPREERLLQHEAASALRQISLHALDVQTWETLDAVRAEIAAIRKQCRILESCVELPVEPEAVPAPVSLVPVSQQPAAAEDARGLALYTPAPEEDEETRLRAEIRVLRELLASLVLERDELLHVTCRELEARYFCELGSLEAEIYRARSLANYYRHRAEYLRAARNREQTPDVAAADEKLHNDFREYQRIYEEFQRRTKEAQAYRPRRESRSVALAEIKKGEDASEAQEPEDREDEDPWEARLKRVYRRIVKAMHPDLHPGQDEATLNLFKRAIQAYKDGDLKTLEEIDGLQSCSEPEPGQDPLQALRDERERLFGLVCGLRQEIRTIKSRFPYTKKELLEDPERLAAEKRRLELLLLQVQQQAERYRREMEELEGKS